MSCEKKTQTTTRRGNTNQGTATWARASCVARSATAITSSQSAQYLHIAHPHNPEHKQRQNDGYSDWNDRLNQFMRCKDRQTERTTTKQTKRCQNNNNHDAERRKAHATKSRGKQGTGKKRIGLRRSAVRGAGALSAARDADTCHTSRLAPPPLRGEDDVFDSISGSFQRRVRLFSEGASVAMM